MWLPWVFVAVHGLSLVAASGGDSLAAVQASLLAEHGLQGARVSVVAARGLGSCGTQA